MYDTTENFVYGEELLDDVTVIGLGALILNGLSYYPIEGNVTILCNYAEQDGFNSGLYKYVYIEGYRKEIGYEEFSSIPSPERAICDFLLYPDKLYNGPVYEAIQFYEDDPDLGDLEQIVEMALKLGIEERKIRSLIQDAQDLRY